MKNVLTVFAHAISQSGPNVDLDPIDFHYMDKKRKSIYKVYSVVFCRIKKCHDVE